MFQFNLRPLLNARGIERHFSFLVTVGITRNTASQLLNNSTGSISLKDMAKLCTLLNCTPNDLLVWRPSASAALPAHHPLEALHNGAISAELAQKLKQMPLADLKKLVEGAG
jgi:DNA-binding Xre family transcriptional regulator